MSRPKDEARPMPSGEAVEPAATPRAPAAARRAVAAGTEALRAEPARGGLAGAEADDEADTTYSIGDLAGEFGITTRTIRFYESRNLITPNRRGTQRFYTRRDRARLSIILRAKNLGFSLEDVAAYLDLYDADPGQQVQTRMLLEKVETAIADLQKKRADLDRTLRDLKDLKSKCVEHLTKTRAAQG